MPRRGTALRKPCDHAPPARNDLHCLPQPGRQAERRSRLVLNMLGLQARVALELARYLRNPGQAASPPGRDLEIRPRHVAAHE
eukprot:3668441-Pyramimonas_sp.AAC.1